jgi:predicted nucleic acid-binding protein
MSETRSLQFVDTNVLIYAHDVSAGHKHGRARELIHDLWHSGEGCLSVQVLQEFYVTVTRKVATPLSPNAAAQIVTDLALWEVHCPRAQDVLEAIHLQQRYRTSFWDAMILTSAIQLGCQILWSEDLNPGQVYERLTVQSPF